MKLLYRLLLAVMILTTSSMAHKEWVHQYIVKQGYLFLESELGFQIPDLRNRIGLNFYGKGSDNDPWGTGLIGVAAWREDLEDPIWGYGGLFQGWTPSSTHFWIADLDDDARTPIPLSTAAFNAFYKAKIYLFGGHRIFRYGPGILPGVGPVLGYFYSWNSLANFYKTGQCYYEGYIHTLDPDNPVYVTPQPLNMDPTQAKRFAAQVLGRVCHLLADMSVPAHVRHDLHPCDTGDPDAYELYMGGNDWFPTVCNDEKTSFPAQNWNVSTAQSQGGLLYEALTGDAVSTIRYLFYTQSQLADHCYPHS